MITRRELAWTFFRLGLPSWGGPAIVAQMRDDELRHAQDAQASGAMALPTPVKELMRAAAKVMTTVAQRI